MNTATIERPAVVETTERAPENTVSRESVSNVALALTFVAVAVVIYGAVVASAPIAIIAGLVVVGLGISSSLLTPVVPSKTK